MITEPPAEIDTTPFAAYVTAANSVEELREAKSSGRLAPGAAWALHVMEASFERVSKYTTPTQSEIDQLRSYFAEWDDEAGTSRANVLRMKSGGDLAQLPASVSPLGEQLAILCRDWYPVFLIHPEPKFVRRRSIRAASVGRDPWTGSACSSSDRTIQGVVRSSSSRLREDLR